MSILEGRRGLILGVANQKSLAWGITRSCALEGAQLLLTYQNEATGSRVRKLAQAAEVEAFLPCDVTQPGAIDYLFRRIRDTWGHLDFVVHAVGFSNPEELRGRYIDTSKDNFVQTMLTSVYSFTEIARHAEPLMPLGGSLLTLSYLGSSKVVPSYNVMGLAKASLESSVRYLASDLGHKGIRVNAISAGPVKTLSASAVNRFNKGMEYAKHASPLGRNITQDDVGKAAVYLLSDYASGVTGETHFVDGGFNTVAMSEHVLDHKPSAEPVVVAETHDNHTHDEPGVIRLTDWSQTSRAAFERSFQSLSPLLDRLRGATKQ